MATTVHGGASAGSAQVARPRRPFNLQDWLETRGAVIAFAVAALTMMLSGAEFYSGGAFSLASLLGPHGMVVFNGVRGLGLAVGCELVGSIAGRDWLYQQAEALEVEEQKGLTKPQRAARKKAYEQAAKRAFWFMLLGFACSFVAALFYVVNATGAHTLVSVIMEASIAAALEGVLVYLGVFKANHHDADKETEEHARDLFQVVLADAAERIRHGIHSLQDVRLVANSFTDKRLRERFQSAYMTTDPKETIWTTRDIMSWLGDPASEALRKRVNRRLKSIMEEGGPVWKDSATGGYQIAKSDAGRFFMEEYPGIGGAVSRTRSGHATTRKPEIASSAAAGDGTRTDRATDTDTGGTYAALEAATGWRLE